MSEGLGSSLLRLAIEGSGNGLGDARVKGGCPTGYNEVGVGLVSSAGPGFAIASARPRKGRMGIE